MTAGLFGSVRIYRCGICSPLPGLLRAARSQVTRGLTPAERREFLAE